MIISFLLILLQISSIAVFLIYKNLRHRILYRIIQFIEQFSSGIYIIAWDHLIIQHFLLALNQHFIFHQIIKKNLKLKEYLLMQYILNNIYFLLIFSWLILGAFEILFLTLCSGVWDNNAVGFYYKIDNICSDIYRQLELYFTIAFPTLSTFCYIAIIIILKKTREKTEITINNNNNLTQQNNKKQKQTNQSFNKQEKRILIISVLLFSIITALIFSWYLNYKYPPWTMLFLIYLFINTSLTLIMNSEYRESFTSQITELKTQQGQQQTAVVKISSTAGGAPLFVFRTKPLYVIKIPLNCCFSNSLCNFITTDILLPFFAFPPLSVEVPPRIKNLLLLGVELIRTSTLLNSFLTFENLHSSTTSHLDIKS
ncbi:7TM_GPCR_Srx domain-containing protein [Meloidogyne graminicola]|uniref:7TM_GPCR_Srx domain-containing protein n=1 Tax=Meloidogyne graminicola TaxID=189291 RepID=A0A8S9Z5V4_9BILA|nr:7TM_GPCR_Srx domain-containing protein [Meloidogyne graminicola]